MFLSVEMLTGLSTALVHLKSKIAEPSQEITESNGLPLLPTMDTFFFFTLLSERQALHGGNPSGNSPALSWGH